MIHLNQTVNCICVPQVVYSGATMISFERDITSVEHPAEELVHCTSVECCSVPLDKEGMTRGRDSGNGHPVPVRHIFGQDAAQRVTDRHNTVCPVLGFPEMNVPILKVHVLVNYGQGFGDAGTCPV